MKKAFVILSFLSSLFFFSVDKAYAYTIDDVAEHNTENDCWVIYDNGVYDITNYVAEHDRYMDIRSWCGTDITEAFETKDGTGRDHKSSSYALLETFYIDTLDKSVSTNTSSNNSRPSDVQNSVTDIPSSDETSNTSSNPYSILLPLSLTLVIYWSSFYIYGRSNLKKFNGFWNTILLLTLLIPSLGFGIFMILRYSDTDLWNIDFDFMYWHVELSIVMGTLGISHLIQRFKAYRFQLKRSS